MRELLAFVFQRKGSANMSVDDFVYGPAADLGWFTSKEMRKVLEIAQKADLVIRDNDTVRTNFDPGTVDIPLGFKPSKDILNEEVKRPVFQRILDEILAGTKGKSKSEIISMVNQKQERMNIEIEVALLLVARELKLTLPNETEYIQELEESIIQAD